MKHHRAPSHANAENFSQEDLLLTKHDEFAWCLIDDVKSHVDIHEIHVQVGSIDSMPYADEVLVLIPTLDVRLVTLKIPLVSDNKIKLILPGLLEEHLLEGMDHLDVQIITPLAGAPALERTVALIDKNWLSWLSSHLAGLASSHIKLVPDCLMLKLPQERVDRVKPSILNQPHITYEVLEDCLVWTARLMDQTGASWIDRIPNQESLFDAISQNNLAGYLPKQLTNRVVAPFKMDSSWFIQAARQFVDQDAHDGINLLPGSFKANSSKSMARVHPAMVRGDHYYVNPSAWRGIKKLTIFFLLSILVSYIVFGIFLTIIDWGMKYQLSQLARPQSQSIAMTSNPTFKIGQSLQVSSGDASGPIPINDFLHDLRLERRKSGMSGSADFPEMAAELQGLMNIFQGQVIKSVEYDGESIVFELDPKTLASAKLTAHEVALKAISMEVALTVLGSNRFRLLPHSGLGAEQ